MSSIAAVQPVANRTGNVLDHSDPDPDGAESAIIKKILRINVIFLVDPCLAQTNGRKMISTVMYVVYNSLQNMMT